jgi:hypothetical protein
MTGAFIALSVVNHRPVFTRAAWAVLLAVLGVALWSHIWGIAWTDIELALTRQWWAICRNLGTAVNLWGGSAEQQAFFERLADAGRPVAQLFPARLVVSGMLGLVLASAWHERITGRPLGRAVERLSTFRFTDHLVWMVILAAGVLLLPGLDGLESLAERSPVASVLLYTVSYWAPVANNVLVVCGALYVARGAAVLSRFLRPGPAIALAVIATLFLLPFALAGLAALGLADTWIDFRRWVQAPSQR